MLNARGTLSVVVLRAARQQHAAQQLHQKGRALRAKRTAKAAAEARMANATGGMQNGLRETDTGRPDGVPENGVGTGLQGQVPGGSQGADENDGHGIRERDVRYRCVVPRVARAWAVWSDE